MMKKRKYQSPSMFIVPVKIENLMDFQGSKSTDEMSSKRHFDRIDDDEEWKSIWEE